MNRSGGDNGFRSQLTGKRALKVIYSHKNRFLPKNGLIAINSSRTVGNSECAGINRHVVGDARALQERRTATPSWPRVLQETARAVP
jgi:hypothetical protein